MPDLHERIHDLARARLDGQERRLAELRSRFAPLLSAVAVIPALLGKDAVAPPHSALQVVSASLGVFGALVALGAGLFALRPTELTGINPDLIQEQLYASGATAQPDVDDELARAYAVAFGDNKRTVFQTEALLLLCIGALACEAAGFLAAAAIRF